MATINPGSLDGLEDIATPDQVQAQQDAQFQRGMGGTSAQQIFAGASRLGRSLFGNPQMQQAQTMQQQIGGAIQNSDEQAPEDEDGLDASIRRLKATYMAVAPLNPQAAMQISNKLALLTQAKTQQDKLNAQTDLETSRARKDDAAAALDLQNKGTLVIGNPVTGKQYGTVKMVDDQGNPIPGYDKQVQAAIAQSGDPQAQAVQQGAWTQGRLQIAQLQAQEKERLAAERKDAANNPPYDPDTARMASMDVLSMPEHMRNYASFGNTGQAARIQINTGIHQLMQDAGVDDSQLNAMRAQAKAYATTVNKMGPQVANLAAFSSLVDANMQRLDALVNRVNPSKYRTVNDWAQALKQEGLVNGQDDAAELQSILTTTQTELGKLLTTANAGGNAAVSDSARNEMKLILDGKLPPSALRRVMGRLKVESGMKVAFANDQIKNATSGIASISSGQAPGQFTQPSGVVGGQPVQVAPGQGQNQVPLSRRIDTILGRNPQ